MKTAAVFFFCVFTILSANAQEVLPDVTVRESGGKVVISWLNDYKKNVTVISIQRSYDSLRNFTTIGSVLNPQNLENGYLDQSPPYNKMYYRVFIAFDGGAYEYSKSQTPVKEILTKIIQTADGRDSVVLITTPEPEPWQIEPIITEPAVGEPKVKVQSKLVHNYGQDVVLDLPNAASRKYLVKFLDENNKLVLEIKDFIEPYLIIEKVNFKKSGTYYFQLYEDGVLIEENSVIISKDLKKNSKR